MYIQTEYTPNHNALKFLIEGFCSRADIFDFNKSSENAPAFAKKMLEVEGVTDVFVTHEFITITKAEEATFDFINPFIFQILLEAKANSDFATKTEEEEQGELCEISKQIIEILEDRVKPAVAMDGGDISFVRFDAESGIVYLKLKGSCSGCPSSAVTLQQGIKRTLQHYVPEVYEVAAV